MDVLPEDSYTKAVEGGDGQALGLFGDQFRNPLVHLFGRLVGEGQRQDPFGRNPPLQEVGDPHRNHPSLAAARTSQKQYRFVGQKDRLPLGFVEVGKV